MWGKWNRNLFKQDILLEQDKMAKAQEIKKYWVAVQATPEFNNAEIGEVPYTEVKTLPGRVLKTNLYLLTNDGRKQNSEISFKITDSDGKLAHTQITGYKILNAYIKKVMRSGKDKVDDSFVCETKDKVKIKVKPFFITKNKTNKLILSKLRLSVRSNFAEYAKQNEFNKIIKDLVVNFIQKELKMELKKIYPLTLFEIRELVREREKVKAQ